MIRWPLIAALMLGLGCGDDAGSEDEPDAGDFELCPIADGTGVSFDASATLCDKLSSYRFFVGDLAGLVPNEGVVPYDLNSPLFTDYAAKYRFIWLPEGTSIDYEALEALRFPVGAVIIKVFAYALDMRSPQLGQRIIETRLLFHKTTGWEGVSYIWNDDQTEAFQAIAGGIVPVSWIHSDGETRDIAYGVPNKNQCKECHEERDDTLGPIGPKARHLNRDFDYASGTENQLTHLAAVGYLGGAPADPADVPKAPVFDDPATGTVDERARGWLDINCSHCHNPRGIARTTGLNLLPGQTNPYEFGVCKTPVATGGGSGGRLYTIVPGAPDDSIMMFRLESVKLDEMMPELGRTIVHSEGVTLIREWITNMEGDSCGAPPP